MEGVGGKSSSLLAGVKRRRPEWGMRSVESFSITQKIGAGTFGDVFKAFDGQTPIALKRIRTDREQQGFPVTAIREIRILKALKHKV